MVFRLTGDDTQIYLTKDNWDEYDHEGSYRTGNPSEWQLACQRLADELNRRDGVEPVGERP